MSSEFDYILENEFFVIDSDDLNVETKLYGYIITENAIITNNDVPFDKEYDKMGGSFVYLINNANELIIKQDPWGSYGLYLFKKDNYFAISNSFLKLVEYVKEIYPLTMNYNFANSFLPADLCSIAYKETLINEIEILPRHVEITIDKIQKILKFNYLDFQEKTINLDSKEGVEILDNWFYKWINFIRFLKKNTNNILIDLSGGFDTRVILTLILNSNIDLNRIRFNSIDNSTAHGHAEDFIIASEISKAFNFKLNQGQLDTEHDIFKELDTILNISLYSKLGFHKQMHFRFSKTTKPLFTITGNGNIRDYPNQYTNDFSKTLIDRAYNFSHELYEDTEILLKNTLSFLEKEFDVKDYYSKELPEIHYRETRNRYHNARVAIEEFISNKFEISPLLDPNLYKLRIISEEHRDDQALIALIFLRYCPELLNFDFEGNRFINKETISLVKKINEKYPFIKKNFELISEPENNTLNLDYHPTSINREKCDFNEPRKFIKKIFLSNSFKNRYISVFPQKTYYKMVNEIKNKNYYPLSNALTAISIIRILNCVEYSQTRQYDCKNSFMKSFLSTKEFEEYNIDSNFIDNVSNTWLRNVINIEENEITFDLNYIDKFTKYLTARIDIKNHGLKENDAIVYDISDEDSFINSPNWFNDEYGKGKVILSRNRELSFKIKCKQDGILDLNLRGVDFRDSSSNRIPIYINFNYLKIDNDIIFDGEKIVCHDKPYKFSKEIKDNQEISIKIKWNSL